MTIYILLAFALALLSLPRNHKWPFYISVILLVTIGGLRAETVGTDTSNYNKLFEWYGDSLSGGFHASEPGYALLQMLVVRAGLPYSTLVFVVQTLTMIVLALYVNKTVYKPQYALLCYLLLYFYFNSFNVARQYLAIPFLLFAFYYLEIGSLKKFLIFIAAGTMFHFTALIGLLALLFIKRRWSRGLQVTMLAFSFLLGSTTIVQDVAANLLSFLPPAMYDYILSVEDYRDLGVSLSRLLLTLFCVCMVVLMENRSNRLCLLTLGICILNLFAFHPVVARVAQYFTIIQIVIIPDIAYMLRPQYRASKAAVEIGAFVYMAVVYIYLLVSNVGGIVPYSIGL